MDILYPPWCEDPAPALAFVRGYLDMPESKGPHGQEARLIAGAGGGDGRRPERLSRRPPFPSL